MKLIPQLLFLLISLTLISCQQKSPQSSSENQGLDNPYNPADSIAFYSEKIAANAKDAPSYTKRAQFHFENNNLTDAIRDLNLSIQLDSTSARNYLMLAEYELYRGKSEISKAALENCLRFNPDNLDAKIKLAEIYMLVNMHKESMQLLVECLKADPMLARAYFLKGMIYLQLGDTAQAVFNFQETVMKNPDSYESYMMLGNLYATKGDSLAKEYYNLALKLYPKSIEAYYGLAMYYQEKAEYEKAIETYLELLEKADNEYVEAYYNLGYIYLNFSVNNQKAIEYFTKVIELRNNYVQAYHNRGVAYELEKRYPEARADYQRALSILPNYDLSIQGLNRLDQLQGKGGSN